MRRPPAAGRLCLTATGRGPRGEDRVPTCLSCCGTRRRPSASPVTHCAGGGGQALATRAGLGAGGASGTFHIHVFSRAVFSPLAGGHSQVGVAGRPLVLVLTVGLRPHHPHSTAEPGQALGASLIKCVDDSPPPPGVCCCPDPRGGCCAQTAPHQYVPSAWSGVPAHAWDQPPDLREIRYREWPQVPQGGPAPPSSPSSPKALPAPRGLSGPVNLAP